jgi:hypothetical protein
MRFGPKGHRGSVRLGHFAACANFVGEHSHSSFRQTVAYSRNVMRNALLNWLKVMLNIVDNTSNSIYTDL